MRLQDLQILKRKPSVNPENTRLLIERVQRFLQTAESSEIPADFENPEETQQHIELNLFIPKGDDNNNSNLLLLSEATSESGSSSSSDSTSSSGESDIEVSTDNRLFHSEGQRSSKRAKIEELTCISNPDKENPIS